MARESYWEEMDGYSWFWWLHCTWIHHQWMLHTIDNEVHPSFRRALWPIGSTGTYRTLCNDWTHPTAVRGMGYGISAGFGKAGVAIGTQAFTPIQEAAGKAAIFYVAGGISVVGMAIYYSYMRDELLS